MADWSLHPQLDRDTASLGDLPLSRVLVMNDANYPWAILVPRKPDVTEVIDLDETERTQLMAEVTRVARALRALTACHKLNIAALGNAVPQLHVHVIARFRTDAAWPKPVWGVVPARAYEHAELAALVVPLRQKIWSE
jgi:diadenosine tetraphosphate (Ap4A) HIT family hydrolase